MLLLLIVIVLSIPDTVFCKQQNAVFHKVKEQMGLQVVIIPLCNNEKQNYISNKLSQFALRYIIKIIVSSYEIV